VAVVLLAGTLFWGIPAAANYLAFKIPDSVSEAAAEQTITTIDNTWVSESDLPLERQEELSAYFRSVDDYPPKILFRDGNKIGANAFALPGGYVVFTDQLVLLAESDAELLGVYLHEVGHARLKHAEISVLQSSGWLVLLTLITGDVSGVSETLFTLPVTLGQLAFSRDMELEADDFAVRALVASGREPEPLAAMLERMEQMARDSESAEDASREENPETSKAGTGDMDDDSADSSWLEYVSSHPATRQRVERIRKGIAR